MASDFSFKFLKIIGYMEPGKRKRVKQLRYVRKEIIRMKIKLPVTSSYCHNKTIRSSKQHGNTFKYTRYYAEKFH